MDVAAPRRSFWRRLACAQGFHEWGRFGEMEAFTVSRVDVEPTTSREEVQRFPIFLQRRFCAACGAIGFRRCQS